MLFKNICAVVVLSFGAIASAQAADKMYDFEFQE
ncbi:excinuclease, partial [bacterium LRH843]|nr:excinuclease [bacterium LRH843]